MPYIQIQDSKLGMERKRSSRVVGALGSLWTLKNAHLTRGGDVERRKSFVKIGNDFPSTTKGLFAINETLYTTGYDASEAGNVPVGVTHLLTQHPTPATALSRSLDGEAFDGTLYTISEFSDGSIYHFYGTDRITDWDSLSSDIASNTAVADALQSSIDNSVAVDAISTDEVITVTSTEAGTAFTVSTSTSNNGSVNDQTLTVTEIQANVPDVDEVLSSVAIEVTGGTNSPGINKTDSITIDGVDILGAAVDWVTSNTATAAAIASQIASYSSVPEYSVSSSGAVVTVKGLTGTGSTPNSRSVSVSNSGDVTTTSGASMSGGVDAVQGIAQVVEIEVGGTFETADQYTVTINGTEDFTVTGGASGTGTSILTFKQKVYSTASSNLYFSSLNAPTQWVSGVDYGFINMASQTAGQETLIGTSEYQGLMAVFSQNTIRVWSISEDSIGNVPLQTLQNTGTIAPKSITPYGNNDVFYLDTSGIRSIKARDSSNSAYTSDVGTAIDTHVVEYMNTLTDAEVAASVGVIEPVDGRFWMAIGKRIYVLSYFPSAKISGFSYYELDFRVLDFARINDTIYCRGLNDDDTESLYLYGGTGGDTYPGDDEDVVVLEFPYFSAQNPASFKELIGFDIIAINKWQVDLLSDPSDDSVVVSQGISDGTTYNNPRFGLTSISSLFGLTLTCKWAGKATFSALAMHYTGTHEDG